MLECNKPASPPSMTGGASAKSASTTSVVKKSSSTASTRKVSYVLSTEALGRSASTTKMPPPPPRMTAEEQLVGGGTLDSLARLYATAKQLDEIPAEHRRDRSVSVDAETLVYETADNNDGAGVRRERSSSCGTAPAARKKNTSPSLCETILEEESPAKGLAEEIMDHDSR